MRLSLQKIYILEEFDMDDQMTTQIETTETEVAEVADTGSTVFRSLRKGATWFGKKVITAVILGGVGGAVYHYTDKHLTKKDEENRIKAAARKAAEEEKRKIEEEKKAKDHAVETSDEGQKVLDETAE